MTELLESVDLPARPGSQINSGSLVYLRHELDLEPQARSTHFSGFCGNYTEITDPSVASASD